MRIKNDFLIEFDANIDGEDKHGEVNSYDPQYAGGLKPARGWDELMFALRYGYTRKEWIKPWLIDYWSSYMPADSYHIDTLRNIKHEDVLKGVMLGMKSNVDFVNFICHVDYLRGSEMPEEMELGNALYSKIKEVIAMCLDNGTFKYVQRTGHIPIVEQNGAELSLEKLSSGSLFLLEHLILLMCKMYSVRVLNQEIKTSEIFNISGVLLIDEIETHLHPKWQKKILGIIRHLFPNLQVILTTHSPFVVASAEEAFVYTCVPRTGYSEICDETEKYSNMPIDEILLSDVFGVVHPFNDEISDLMKERKHYIEAGQIDEAKDIAKKLKEINPEYFMFM